jgi:diguanylate cyclase (GGDEF)-like protein
MLTRHVAGAEVAEIPAAILTGALEFSGADYGFLTFLGERGEQLTAYASPAASPVWRTPVTEGLAQWAMHAREKVEVADISQSAWSHHLAGEELPVGAIVGVPLTSDDKVFGALVVGGADLDGLESWSVAIASLAEAGTDALLLARRLLATGGGAMVDQPSGAYNLRFLEDLLEKEISRAGRHRHQLSLVFFHTANYEDLLQQLGEEGTEEVLAKLVDLLRSHTRKVNSLARVNETDFCLVIPEADEAVANKIAGELRNVAQSEAFTSTLGEFDEPVQLALQTTTVSNPRAVDAVLRKVNHPAD